CYVCKAEDGIRDRNVTGVQTVCSSDLTVRPSVPRNGALRSHRVRSRCSSLSFRVRSATCDSPRWLEMVRPAVPYLPAAAVEANRFMPRTREMWKQARWPRTLLPAESNLGEKVPRAPLPGAMATMPPETPDFAGRPISNSHSPLFSYIPQEASRARLSRAISAETTR